MKLGLYINTKFLEMFKIVNGTRKTEKYVVGYDVEST